MNMKFLESIYQPDNKTIDLELENCKDKFKNS
jgi:hypothetical protein